MASERRKNSKPDWTKIENEYITTQISYRQLAQKYSVSETTVNRYGKQHDWQQKRQQYVSGLAAEMLVRARKNTIKEAENILMAAGKVAKGLIERAQSMIDCGEINNGKQLESCAEALKTAVYVIRDLYKLPNQSEEHAQRIANEKLEIEKQKAVNAADEKSSEVIIRIEGKEDYGA